MGELSKEAFMKNTAHLSEDPANAGANWYTWAQELAEMDCPDPGVPGQPPEYFLDWIWKELQQVAGDYGETAARNVVELGLNKMCLFPWELYRAGEEFSLGRSRDEVFDLSLEGMLDKPQEENEDPVTMSP